MAGKRSKHSTRNVGLSVTDIKFCQLKAVHRNATQCYIDAGYHCPVTASGEIDRPTVGKRAWELLKKPEISSQIRMYQREAADVAQISVTSVARSLKLESVGPGKKKLFDRKGRIKPPHLWPEELWYCIAGFEAKEITRIRRDPQTGRTHIDKKTKKVERETVTEYKVRFVNPTESKKVLAQWLGMIGDKDHEVGSLPPLTSISFEEDATADDIESQLRGEQFANQDAELPAELQGLTPPDDGEGE